MWRMIPVRHSRGPPNPNPNPNPNRNAQPREWRTPGMGGRYRGEYTATVKFNVSFTLRSVTRVMQRQYD